MPHRSRCLSGFERQAAVLAWRSGRRASRPPSRGRARAATRLTSSSGEREEEARRRARCRSRAQPRRGGQLLVAAAHHAVQLEVQDAAQHLAHLRRGGEAQREEVLAADLERARAGSRRGSARGARRRCRVSSSAIAASTASSGSPRGELVQLGLARAARHAVDQAPADDEARAPARRRRAGGCACARSTTAISSGSRSRSIQMRRSRQRGISPSRRCARAQRGRRACTSSRVVGAGAQAPVDRRREAELLHAPQREVGALLLEQRDELVAQARRREVADQVHGAAGARQVEGVRVHAQAVAVLVADGAQHARGVLDEAQVVEHDDAPRREVGRGRRSSRAGRRRSRA